MFWKKGKGFFGNIGCDVNKKVRVFLGEKEEEMIIGLSFEKFIKNVLGRRKLNFLYRIRDLWYIEFGG